MRRSQGYSHSLTPGFHLTTNLGLRGLAHLAGGKGLETGVWSINMWELVLVIQVTYFSAGTVFLQDGSCISQNSLGTREGNQAIVALVRKGPHALQGNQGIHEIIGRARCPWQQEKSFFQDCLNVSGRTHIALWVTVYP